MRRRGVLGFIAVAACLLAAVPASATHHPPNADRSLVTLTASRSSEDRKTLALGYVVEQQPCPPGANCLVNYGKPYSINIYVDAPDGTNGLAPPTPKLIQGFGLHCSVASQPLVRCNVPGRDQNDPAAALPLSGLIEVQVGTKRGATALIHVAGYSLNNYQDRVPVPAWDCEVERVALDEARAAFDDRAGDIADELVRLSRTGPVTDRRIALSHDFAAAKARETIRDVKALFAEYLDKNVAFRKCDRGETKNGSPSNAVQARACTDDEWTALLARADTLKLTKMVPLVKKIVAAQKARKSAKAARLRKQLKRQLSAERKSITAYRKALAHCLS